MARFHCNWRLAVPVMVFMESPVEERNMQHGMYVVGSGLQPPRRGAGKGRPEVHRVVVAMLDPAGEEPRHSCRSVGVVVRTVSISVVWLQGFLYRKYIVAGSWTKPHYDNYNLNVV